MISISDLESRSLASWHDYSKGKAGKSSYMVLGTLTAPVAGGELCPCGIIYCSAARISFGLIEFHRKLICTPTYKELFACFNYIYGFLLFWNLNVQKSKQNRIYE